MSHIIYLLYIGSRAAEVIKKIIILITRIKLAIELRKKITGVVDARFLRKLEREIILITINYIA
jgi:hypothetical protein